MWAEPEAKVEQWEAALALTHVSPECATAAANCLCAALRFNEVLVGGDDSPCLVQLLAAGRTEGAADVDVLASVLLPTEEVAIVYTTRGDGVHRLLASFWTWRPNSPTVLVRAGTYVPLLCSLRGVDTEHWSVGPLSAAHVRLLQNSQEGAEADMALQIFTLAPPSASGQLALPPSTAGTEKEEDPEQSRAAVVHPPEIRSELCT